MTRANACRTRGQGGKAEVLVAAQQASLSAPAKEGGGWDSSVEGASGLESDSVGALYVERVLGTDEEHRRESVFRSGATGSVSDRAIRPALCPNKRWCRFTPRKGGGPLQRGARMVTGHSSETRLQPRHDSRSGMPSGYPAPPWKGGSRSPARKCGLNGFRSEAAVAEVRAQLSRDAGFRGCS
jgi:hypothetical protein